MAPVEVKNLPKNSATVKRLIIKILPYSAINKNANIPLPYSILNPETSSDSPSARSKGARLVSAREEITHIMDKGIIRRANQRGCSFISTMLKFILNKMIIIRINDNLTS